MDSVSEMETKELGGGGGDMMFHKLRMERYSHLFSSPSVEIRSVTNT